MNPLDDLEQAAAEAARRRAAAGGATGAAPADDLEQARAEAERRRQARESLGSNAADIGLSTLQGLRTGAESAIGIGGDLSGLARNVLGGAARMMGYEKGADAIQNYDIPWVPDISSETVHDFTDDYVPDYEPTTQGGKYARSIADFVPGMLLPGGPVGIGRKMLASIIGGGASETAGQLTEGTAAEPWARAIGGIAGSGLSEAGAGLAQAARTRGARAAEAAAEDAALQHGVRLTRGQRTGNVNEQMAEQQMLHGARGSRAQELMQGRTDANRQALTDAAGNIQEGAAPTRGSTPAESGSNLTWSTRRRVERLKKEGGEKIERALKSGVMVNADRLRALPGELSTRLEGNVPFVPDVILDDTTPVAKQAMSRIEKFVSQAKDPNIKEISLAGAEQLRRQLIQMEAAPKSLDSRALGKIREYFDDWLEGSAGNIDDLKEGRKLYREGKQIEEPTGKPTGGKAVAGIAKGQHAEDTARLFTPNDKGELSGSAIDAIDRLKATGASQADLDQVRGIVMDKLMSGDPGKVATRVENFIRNNPSAANALFSSDDLERMSSWANTNRRTVPDPKATNPSRSGYNIIGEMAKQAGKQATQSGGVIGSILGGPLGAVLGAGAGLATDAFSNWRNAGKAKKALAPADRSSLAEAMAKGGRRGATGAVTGATGAARIDDPGGEGHGERVEIIEEGENMVRVRMPDGSEKVIGKNLVKRE